MYLFEIYYRPDCKTCALESREFMFGNFSALTYFQTPSIVWISIGVWWYPDLSASHIADIAPGWGPMVRPSRHGAISWPPRAGIDGPSVCIALRKWIYIYTAAVTVAKLAFRIFCDLDRKSRSLCLNYVIGVPWMHGVIVMCFVHRDQGLLILLWFWFSLAFLEH